MSSKVTSPSPQVWDRMTYSGMSPTNERSVIDDVFKSHILIDLWKVEDEVKEKGCTLIFSLIASQRAAGLSAPHA